MRGRTPANRRRRVVGTGRTFRSALWAWARRRPGRAAFLLRVGLFLLLQEVRRRRQESRLGFHVPWVVAVSPTMRCNYDCVGCYSRGRPTDRELTEDELDQLLREAETLGVLAFVLTGGEPFMIEGLSDLIARHPRLLFVTITNGALVDRELARRLARAGNVVPLVSLEGFVLETDARRRAGAHNAVLSAFAHLREEGVCFGFAAMNTAENGDLLGSEAFVDEMIAEGCALGFLTEYVPCGDDPRPEWLLEEAERTTLREKVLRLRADKPFALIQFPHDEYGEDNLCGAAGRASLHINSQGGIEPCPLAAVPCGNVRQGGLAAAFRSPYLRAIRERPELLRRERMACSLFEHREEIELLARAIGEGRGCAP